MYEVNFVDTEHGDSTEHFETFDDAAEYWQEYADVLTCMAGSLVDLSNGEVIWDFDCRELK